jgi:hypothetical protein
VDTVKRHINDDAATILVAYAWTDTNNIRTLVDEAGFHAIEMQVIESLMRWPSSADGVAEFIAHAAARSPRAPFTSEVTAARTVMVQEVRAALRTYLEDNDFVMSGRSNLVQARAD